MWAHLRNYIRVVFIAFFDLSERITLMSQIQHQPIYPFIHTSTYSTIDPSIHLSIRASTHPSTDQPCCRCAAPSESEAGRPYPEARRKTTQARAGISAVMSCEFLILTRPLGAQAVGCALAAIKGGCGCLPLGQQAAPRSMPACACPAQTRMFIKYLLGGCLGIDAQQRFDEAHLPITAGLHDT